MPHTNRTSERRAVITAACVAAVAVVIVASAPGIAATIHVPDDQPTIQAGIDAASEGDIVLVAPGTYTGWGNVDLDFGGTNLVLMSEAGAFLTTIDCSHMGGCEHRGIYMHNGEGPTSVVEGLTIKNGCVYGSEHSSVSWMGGGMYCGPGCAPTIRNCRFENCSADGWWGWGIYGHPVGEGGGLYCVEDLSITGCTFSGNSARICGGGMYCEGSPVLTDCTFYGNSSVDWIGGGMYSSGSPTLTNCIFWENSAGEGWVGGGGMCSYGSPIVTNCRFERNNGSGVSCGVGPSTLTNCVVSENSSYGVQCNSGHVTLNGCTITGNAHAGVFLWPRTNFVDALLMNCTIAGNSCAPDGGAVSCSGDNNPSSLTLNECVVASNTGGCAILCSGAFTDPVLSCCDIYGNAGGDWVGCIADQYGINSNFSDDPLFCLQDNPGEPYSLHEGSPCLPENSPCGELVGALGQGCGAVTVVENTSWGAIKAMYR